MSTFWGPGSVLGPGDTTVNKTDRTCVLEFGEAGGWEVGSRSEQK